MSTKRTSKPKAETPAAPSLVRYVVRDSDGDESNSYTVESEEYAARQAREYAQKCNADTDATYKPYTVHRVEEYWTPLP